ncbi:hypothetical protein C2845_PM18G07520 [Panicum miliaceum]|uniref:Uncharacterized protein n=1 Tax=Panicum miliaceum TaxID=4540 RepID=A0A3L6PG46_PANMI|nr:hypothetical protein C2845_PM18G07520 [Panicum miliaceum]
MTFEDNIVSGGPARECQRLPVHHVVRRLEEVAAVREGASARKTVSGTVQFALWDGFRTAKCGFVLFVQSATLEVLGVQRFDLPDNV